MIRDDLHAAYQDARRHKRTTLAQIEFEENLEENMEDLCRALTDGSYEPYEAFCFITFDPVQREVFASQFRDRVVQHMLYNYLAPLFERVFIHDTYSCRTGFGTTYGVERFCHHLRSVTNNFTEEAWVLMADLSGYFMSIDKKLLIDTIMDTLYRFEDRISDDRKNTWGERIDIGFCEFLLHRFLDRNPSEGCIKLGKPTNWKGLPDNKRLSNSPEGVGIVIGDIISQLFSNINLNITDQWAKRERKLKHWGHYVDDHFVMSRDMDLLLLLKEHELEEVFRERAHVTLHQKKCHITPAYGAHQFLGAYIWPHYIAPRQRTIDKFCLRTNEMEYALLTQPQDFGSLCQVRASLNSYIGLMMQSKSFQIRKNFLDKGAFNKYFEFDDDFTKATVRKEYIPDFDIVWPGMETAMP